MTARKKKTRPEKKTAPKRKPTPEKKTRPRTAESTSKPRTSPGPRRVDAANHVFEALLDYLKRSRGFDFTGYKRSTLLRRVSKRMHEVEIGDYVGYQDYLESNPDELASLFDTILINVTAFFRDEEAWKHLADKVLPALLAARTGNTPIRVWSAGCASGEEAYTLAMLLAEHMGGNEVRRRVKIYATDIDEAALAAARRAVYSARQVEAVPAALREKYFERHGANHVFRPELRRSVIFGRHDLVQDAPISRIDLMVCRNVLMYLNSETQSRVLARLHFGLAPDGFLFLGKAEMLLSHADLFEPLNLKQRIFRKAPEAGLRQRLAVLADAGDATARIHLDHQQHVLDSAFDASPVAQIVVDTVGTLARTNRAAQDLFALAPADLGRPIQDLEISYRPVELRSLLEQAREQGRTVRVGDVEKPGRNGEARWLDVEVSPLRDAQGALLGTSVAFVDRSEAKQLNEELESTREQLEHANEELQSANEELETTNEELQSTNEELETTNEELQSGNEELETMNEELQSTNDELRTINDQLQTRSQELRANESYLEAVLEGMRAAVVVLDGDLRVLSWVEKMQELWGLRADEVTGRSFAELDIGLPVEALEPALRACVRGDAEVPPVEIEAINRRGRPIRCSVTCTPLRQEGEVEGAIALIQRMGEEKVPADRLRPRRSGAKRGR